MRTTISDDLQTTVKSSVGICSATKQRPLDYFVVHRSPREHRVWSNFVRVKRLAGNEIEQGIGIPTIKSRASNIPVTKGTTYVVMRSDR